MDDITTQLLREQIAQTQKLVEKIAALAGAVDNLTARVERLEEAIHAAPCRHLERLASRVEAIENWRGETLTISRETKGRFTNLFWVLVTNAATAGLATLGTLLALGYRTYINQ